MIELTFAASTTVISVQEENINCVILLALTPQTQAKAIKKTVKKLIHSFIYSLFREVQLCVAIHLIPLIPRDSI